MKVSIISPVYKAENIIDELVSRIVQEMEKLTLEYELILVEDGSPDNCWLKIEENCFKNPKVIGIKLSRNFGQHYAVTAGVQNASGDIIVIMDCDLQDDPVYIGYLYEQIKSGYDIVFTRRRERKHGFIKSFHSWFYNKLFEFFADRKFSVDAGSLVCFNRQVKDAFLTLKDGDRLYLQVLKWVGFNTTTIEVEHKNRFEGKSSYSFLKLVQLGIQGWTSHSDKLLKLTSYAGFVIAALSVMAGIGIVIGYFFYKLQTGWSSIIISIFFSTGLILMSIGIAGIYIGKIFEQVKGRPLYIVEKKVNYGK